MPIKGLTDRTRPPRLGKIRLGKKRADGSPQSTDYFLCPAEVREIYGEEPRELDIMFLSDDIEDVFPAYYKMYGQTSGLKCRGDGITADKLNKETGQFEEIECKGSECPNYQEKQCRRIGALKFLLPQVNGIGIWEIDTSSYNSILNIYSMIGEDPIGLIRALTHGRIKMISFKLIIEKREVQVKDKKRKVPIMELRCDEVNLSKLMGKTKDQPAIEHKPDASVLKDKPEEKKEPESKPEPEKKVSERLQGLTGRDLRLEQFKIAQETLGDVDFFSILSMWGHKTYEEIKTIDRMDGVLKALRVAVEEKWATEKELNKSI